jgi:DNA-binding NarL/FixJ family response regulator
MNHDRYRAAAPNDTTWPSGSPRDGARLDLEARTRQAAQAWGLSGRQQQVLLMLAQGLSNKELAQHLDCAEVTIEYHVGALLRRAHTDTRGRLVAKFWLELPPLPPGEELSDGGW